MEADAIFAAVTRFLDEAHTEYLSAPIPEGHSIYCPGLSTPSKLKTISQTIETWRTNLVTYAHCLIFTPTEHIDEMAKFVALANCNASPGNFDLDVDTGEIRYRLYFDCASFDTLPSSYLKHHLPIPLLMLDQYGDAILSVANGTSTAEAALAQALVDGFRCSRHRTRQQNELWFLPQSISGRSGETLKTEDATRTGEPAMDPAENIFEKAQQVTEMMNKLRDRMERNVFKGESYDGSVRIALWGTGEPVAVSVSGPFPDEVREALARGIEEALARCSEARVAFMTDGLENIQREAGVGPDFQMPF
jgi:DNA-binding protein YbaB